MLKIEVVGNLGADAEVKEANGTKFLTFRVAHTAKKKQSDGQEIDSTTWVDCTFNNLDSGIIPYLKKGVKVFVRGNGGADVYSSKQLHKMMGKIKCSVTEIELCGGTIESVPREIIDPTDGAVYPTQKFYWCNAPTKGMKKDDTKPLIDVRGNQYVMNNQGFVAPIIEGATSEDQEETADSQG